VNRGRRNQLALLGVVAAWSVTILVPGVASGYPATGEVGGPPTLGGERHPDQETEAIVIGRGRMIDQPVEIVAVDTYRSGLCVYVDRPEIRISVGACVGDPSDSPDVSARLWDWSKPLRGNAEYSGVSGLVAPEAALVRVRYPRFGHRRRARAIVARPDSEILSRLNQAKPFAYFYGAARRCIRSRSFVVSARAEDGSLIGRDRGIHAPKVCKGSD
jgi:hypothetical protein